MGAGEIEGDERRRRRRSRVTTEDAAGVYVALSQESPSNGILESINRPFLFFEYERWIRLLYGVWGILYYL